MKNKTDTIIRTDTLMNSSSDTIVIGWRKEDNKIVFLKSYNYLTEQVEAQADLKSVIDAGHTWQISHIQCLKFANEDQN
jgi:hypothetical protein